MRKKVLVILSVILSLILITALYIKQRNIANFFGISLENISFKMPQTKQYGDIGKDTKFVLGDGKFQLVHTYDKYFDFIMKYDESQGDIILKDCLQYKHIGDYLYVFSKTEGYAVVDQKSNLCRVYIIVSPEQFTNGYTIDSAGIKHTISRFVNDEHIQYVSDFNVFSEEEQEIFIKMR